MKFPLDFDVIFLNLRAVLLQKSFTAHMGWLLLKKLGAWGVAYGATPSSRKLHKQPKAHQYMVVVY